MRTLTHANLATAPFQIVTAMMLGPPLPGCFCDCAEQHTCAVFTTREELSRNPKKNGRHIISPNGPEMAVTDCNYARVEEQPLRVVFRSHWCSYNIGV
jgi:hypothetical protein